MYVQKVISKSFRYLISAGLLIGISASCLAGCVGKEPIRIGFVAQLTDIQAELGVQERNGVKLAVEEINTAGGVAERPIELIICHEEMFL